MIRKSVVRLVAGRWNNFSVFTSENDMIQPYTFGSTAELKAGVV